MCERLTLSMTLNSAKAPIPPFGFSAFALSFLSVSFRRNPSKHCHSFDIPALTSPVACYCLGISPR